MTTFFYFNNLIQTTEQATQKMVSMIIMDDLIDPDVMPVEEDTFFILLDRYEGEEH